MKTFETSLSKQTRWAGYTMLVVAAVGLAIILGHDGLTGAPRFAAWLVVVVLAVAYALSTRFYEVGDGTLFVHRVFGTSRFELRGATVRRDAEAFKGLVKVFGNGGFFAFDGMFHSRRLGSVRLFTRNKDHGIVIVLAGGKKLLLSPDDPDGFIGSVTQAGASIEVG